MANDVSGGFRATQPIATGNDLPQSGDSSNSWERPPEKNKKRMLWILALFLLLLIGGGVFWYFSSGRKIAQPDNQPEISPPAQEKPVTLPETTAVTPEVTPLFGDANYRSENYRVGDIAIGGEAAFFLSEDDPSPLEITDVRGDAFTEKNKQEVRLVITWRTNKLSKADVEYSKGVGQAPKISSEDDFSLSHSMVLSGLDQASTYVYVIKSHDRFGNEQSSDQHAVYTGSKTVSLFDLIADAVGEVFGWAVKKK